MTPLLRGRFGDPYVYLDTVPTTQEPARSLPHGGVVACELQTAGRGRLGRAWECPHGAGVMFSLALEPTTPVERLPALSLVIADAVCDAVGLDAQVRWPNDIVIGDRKLCGVLAEHRDGKLVVGVGLNANLERDELPTGARVAATSLRLETGAAIDRPQLLADLLWALEQRYAAFEQRRVRGPRARQPARPSRDPRRWHRRPLRRRRSRRPAAGFGGGAQLGRGDVGRRRLNSHRRAGLTAYHSTMRARYAMALAILAALLSIGPVSAAAATTGQPSTRDRNHALE